MMNFQISSIAAVIVLVMTAAISSCSRAVDSHIQKYGEPRQLCVLTDKRINESSGIAVSRRNKDAFWTHNDSGDSPRIFLLNKSGETTAVTKIKGASAIDWEDIASFKIRNQCYVLIADIGDNNRIRKYCTLYIIREPVFGIRAESAEAIDAESKPVMTISFKYEDGAHDCESVAVDPTDLTIYLVSKESGIGSKVYSLSIPEKESKDLLTAKSIATLNLPGATAMDISSDGMRAVILTHNDAYELVREKEDTWADAFSQKPRRINMPSRKQGESICYGTDGKTLYLTSEHASQPLWEVPVSEKGNQ